MSRLSRILRWLVGGLGVVVLAALSIYLYAPYADGPVLGYIAGGPLDGTGSALPPDASGWTDVLTVELETNPADPRSVTVGLIVFDGSAFVPATLRPDSKRWPRDVGRDANVRVRVGETIYRARVSRILDAELHAHLAELGQQKYNPRFFAPERTWFYRLDARTAS